MNQHASRPLWKSLAIGLLLGACAVAACVAGLLALTLLAGLPLLLLIALGFGDTGSLLWLIAGIGVGLAVGLVVVVFAARWAVRKFASWHKDGWTWAAMAVGAAGTIALAVVFAPPDLKDLATRLATGESTAARAPLATANPEIQHMRTVVRPAAEAGDPQAQFTLGMALLHGAAGEKRDREAGTQWIKRAAAQADGIEARLLLAVERQAAPIPSVGRIRTRDDVNQKVQALLALRSTLPAPWLPVMLATSGQLLQVESGAERAADAPMRTSLAEAGQAGSRAFLVYAAKLDEAAAHYAEVNGQHAEADAAWQRALEGYARAGAIFETERLRREMLPERLRSLAVPAVADNLLAPDADFAARLWRLASNLDSDQVHGRAGSGNGELAASAALLAMERSPHPAEIAGFRPARGWFDDPWALGRWLLVLRHARGDCMAAVALSDTTRAWRRPAVANRDQPPGTSFDYAWARAWAESAERCAQTDADKTQVARRLYDLKALSHYQHSAPGELDNARAGVATMLDALR